MLPRRSRRAARRADAAAGFSQIHFALHAHLPEHRKRAVDSSWRNPCTRGRGPASGADVDFDARTLLGDSKVGVAMDGYTHVFDTRKRKAVARIDRMLHRRRT